MKAAVRRGSAIVIDDVETPVPAAGQVLVRTRHCGICGSDLHAVHHFDTFIDAGRRTGLATGKLDASQDIVFGHEFSAEIVDFGPQTEKLLKVGSLVTAIPVNLDADGPQAIGFSHRYPGGFSEYMVLTEAMLYPATNGLPSEYAALAEPMSVAAHAVGKADKTDSCYMVVGCGPIGLAIIAELKSRGLGPVIAVDPIAGRRQVAEQLGADAIVDPNTDDPHDQWAAFGLETGPTRYPRTGGPAKRAVVFECVGKPGMLGGLFASIPRGSQIIVAGVCMGPDTIEPILATNRELELVFVLAYTAAEFTDTMHRMCEGTLNVAPLVGDVISLTDTPAAFASLLDDPRGAKVMVAPGT